MKIKVTFQDKNTKEHKFYLNFIRFIQNKLPLKNNLKINFLNERIGNMTTGARLPNNELNILTKNRMNRDILRTLVHEWVHEYQMTILGRERGPNIGGKNEDEANAISAKLIKIFEKEHPNFEGKMYE